MKGKNVVKKIICIVVVFTMLVSNFISPVISIANELNESEKANITETNVEPNNNNEGGEEPVADESTTDESTTDESNSVDETQAKIDEIDAAFEASQEKDNEQEPKENEDDNDKESKEQIEDNEESNNLIENQDQTQPSNAKGAKKSAPVLRGANNQSSEAQSDKIEDRITPDKIDEVTVKTKNDAYEINSFSTEFVSGATKDENNNLVWTPTSSAAGHEFTFRVNYAISGLKEHPAEAIKITIPKQILVNRNGEFADKYMMSLPTPEESDEETEFAYIENDDYIVVYNPNEITAAINGYFEVSYATSNKTTEYFDYNTSKLQTVLEGGTASNPFNAVITVKTTVNDEEDILVKKSDNKNIYINTNAKIISTQKNYPTIYREWNNSWTEQVPDDKDEYYYLMWTVASDLGDATQRYNFSLTDTIQNLTEGAPDEDYQFVGYRLSGERYFTENNVSINQTTTGRRYDNVLTRHKKSTFDGLKYTLKNSVVAKVDPIDQVDPDTTASGSNTFGWDPVFVPPVGAFYMYKYGNNYGGAGNWKYSSYDLDKLKNGEVSELKGFYYETISQGYAYPWTLKEGGSSNNPADYGYNPVFYDVWDDTLNFEDDENPMTKDDYYIEKMSWSLQYQDVEFDDFYLKFNSKNATFEENEIVTFYGKFNGSTEWVEIGTYNLKTEQITKNDEYVNSFDKMQISFNPEVNCTGWRATTSNKHFYTSIHVNPSVVLKNSNYILEKSENKDAVKIKNTVHLNVKDYKNEEIFDNETSAVDYARVSYYASSISKEVAIASNNKTKKQFSIRWRIGASEGIISGKGGYNVLPQKSGRFYDLIPMGGQIDLNSIEVKANSSTLSKDEYSYEVISNYNNSGRTLLIVDIPVESTGYSLYYSTIHPWNSMLDYGKKVLNPVAYETGNDKITYGYPDNGGNLSRENKLLFNDLDITTNDKKFIYTERQFDINGITAATAGLSKKVKKETESNYSYETVVEPNGGYSYQLRYQNTFMNKANDLVFYDSMENFNVVDSDNNTVTRSSWKGKIQSIDISQLTKKGIKPVVYISTIENLNIEENKDLSNTEVWTKVTNLNNVSNAKAIAIDMSKDVNGNDYILNPGDAVTATIYMKAPNEVSIEADSQPYTFNNIYISNTLIDEFNGSKENFIHQDYTKVRFHWVGDVYLSKVNEENEAEAVKDITFRLHGTSMYGNEIDEFATSNSKGKVVFKNIESGEYILQEYEGTPDWLADYTEYTVKIEKDRIVYIDDVWVDEATPKKITNHPRVHADVLIKKRNMENKGPVQGAKFKLSGISEYGTEILMYSESNNLGEIEFKDLEYGIYELKEVKTPEGYIENINTYRVIVDENGNFNVSVKLSENADTYGSVYDNGSYYIYNEPYHKVRFIKKDAYTQQSLKGAEYKLYGVSDYGSSYNQEKTSNSLGFVEFDGLEPGTFILQETKAPELVDDQGNVTRFVLDATKRLVTIDRYGEFTISESEKNENGYYVINNERNKGQIVINKEWVDESNNDERPEPTVYISNEKPVAPKSAAYIRNDVSYYTSPAAGGLFWHGALEFLGGPRSWQFRDSIGENATGSFLRNVSLEEDEVLTKPYVRIDSDYENENAKYKIYAWEEDNNVYWWSNADVIKMTDESKRLFYTTSFSYIDCSDIDTSELTDMSEMFESCSNLISVDLSGFYTENAIEMYLMFSGCNELEILDLSNFDTLHVTNMQSMFYNCRKLKTIYVSDSFIISNVTLSTNMFTRCLSIVGGDGRTYNSSYTDKTYAYADGGYCTYKESTRVPATDTPENQYSDNRILYSSADTNYDNDGNIVQWIKDGNKWKYIFYVDDPNSTWWAWEDDLPGYYSNFDIRNPEEVENQEVNLINYIFNTRKKVNVEPGNLEISKTLIGVNQNESVVLTKEDDSTEFTFVVTLIAQEGSEELINGTKIFGDYVFNNGVCVLKLRAGETVTITNLPKNMQYKVTERKTPGYEILQSNYYGTIKKDETSKIEAYNYKNAITQKVGFKIVKKDIDTNEVLPGAKFKLSSAANSENYIEIELESNEKGEIEFNNLDIGNYILKETVAPIMTDEQGNSIKYLIDSVEYLVSIDTNGIVTIDGIEKDENGNYVFYNERNKGQIKITKKWVDGKDNDSRPEPVVYISNKKPKKTRQYFRDNYNQTQSLLKYINESTDAITGKFERNTELSEEEVVAKGAVRLDKDYEKEYAEFKIYGWIDENNNCWWWSNADYAVLRDESNSIFYNLRNIKQIDLSDIDTSEMTDMSNMFYQCNNLTELDLSSIDTSNVTKMIRMFSECSSLLELDLSSFDTSKVTSMESLFYNCRSIRTIYASTKFVTTGLSGMGSDFYIFYNNDNLVGGNGTIMTSYGHYGNGQSYACIDKPGQQGMFTEKDFNSSSQSDNEVSNNESGIHAITYSSLETNLDDEGNEVQWVKNGDVWNYSFYVDNPDDTWYLWEDQVEGYKVDRDLVEIINQEGTITNYTEDKTVVVKPEVGSLSISKTLIGIDNTEERELTKQDDDTKFIFTITLNADETKKSLINGKKVFGGYIFNNGVATIQLAAGETETIAGIPEGLTYKIVEKQIAGYDTFGGASGEIIKNQICNVNAINYKDIRTQTVPKYTLKLVKKDYTSGDVLQGAKFVLKGTSNYANSYNKEIESDEYGNLEFTDIEPGMYILQETRTPSIEDDQGNSIKYILDDTQYKVNINDDGTIIIDGLEKENNEFILYNKRDYGQIIVTKKWMDNSNNNERSEPVIYISNKVPQITSQSLRNNYNSSNGPLYYINSNYKNIITGEFKRKYNLTENEVQNLGAVRIDAEYDNENAEYKIYSWIDDEGNCYWWSNADVIKMKDSSNMLFYGMSKVKNINLVGIDTSEMTDMSNMFYECNNLTELDLSSINTRNVTKMNYMFFYCSSLTELNVSNFDTSNVTRMDGMFSSCSSLLELDLSSFNTNKVTDMGSLFSDCESIRTIYASTRFVTTGLSGYGSDFYMFYNNDNLVGGNGTRMTSYGYYGNGKSYARIDKPGQQGMFTEKAFNSPSSSSYENNDNESGIQTIVYSTANTNYDNQNNEVNWVKAGDTWTYSFYIDGTYDKLYVWENGMDGYCAINDILHPGIVEDNRFTISNYSDTNKKFINVKKGNLSLSKALILREGTTETTLTSDEDNTEFTFKVELSASGDLVELINGTKVFGDYIFKDGVCYIVLKAGETAQITDIPAGISYNITELHSIGYETFEGTSGTIVANQTATVQAKNYKKPKQDTLPPPRKPSSEFTSFTLVKKVTGNGETDDTYNFEITLDNLAPEEMYYLSNGQTFTSDSLGSANVSVSLKNNESVIVQNIPVGAKYKVYEHAGDYISSYVITDANNLGLINNTAKNNTKTNKDLSTSTETADDGEDVTITFTNRRTVTQNLKIRKTVTDTEDTNSYMFDIEFANLEEGTSIDSTVGKLDEEDGKIEITIYLAGGEEAEFYNIPVGTTYVVKELASTAIASYTITDANGGNNIVSSSKANTAARKALSTERETVNQGEEATVTFINDTVNQEPDSVSASLGVTKKVVDKDGEYVNNCNETFTFELKAEDDANPMPDKQSVTITGNGEASFGTITFDQTGTYKYTVVEKAGTNEECTYDDTVYTIVYEVTNAEGLLEVTKTIKKNGFIGDVVEFTNIIEGEDEPDNPGTPDGPGTPDEPTTPDEPGKPDEPTTPDEPITPNEPSEPDEPTNPDKPEQPEEPENKDEEKPTSTPDKPNSPQTGDNIVIAVVIGMLAIMVFVVTKKKRCNGKHF